jgi:hypothetical protein
MAHGATDSVQALFGRENAFGALVGLIEYSQQALVSGC